MKDLTNSNIERQNILNNKYAIQSIHDYIGFPGMLFEGEYRYTKEMLAEFFVGFGIICIPMMIVAGVTGIIETRRERRGR